MSSTLLSLQPLSVGSLQTSEVNPQVSQADPAMDVNSGVFSGHGFYLGPLLAGDSSFTATKRIIIEAGGHCIPIEDGYNWEEITEDESIHLLGLPDDLIALADQNNTTEFANLYSTDFVKNSIEHQELMLEDDRIGQVGKKAWERGWYMGRGG